MANEIIKIIAEDVLRLDSTIKDIRELIALADDAGRPTAELKTRLREAEIEQRKWKDALKARGYVK